LQLREVIYRLVVAGANGSPPGPGDLREFNAAPAPPAPGRGRAGRRRVRLGLKDLGAGLDAPLGVVLESAAQLLTSPGDLTRVGHCAGETCDWLFIDTSRNRSRRWCSMSGCGNRAKARRHHQRKRAAV
jgi:predicted RNA-binding Zn ribbon-like protein